MPDLSQPEAAALERLYAAEMKPACHAVCSIPLPMGAHLLRRGLVEVSTYEPRYPEPPFPVKGYVLTASGREAYQAWASAQVETADA